MSDADLPAPSSGALPPKKGTSHAGDAEDHGAISPPPAVHGDEAPLDLTGIRTTTPLPPPSPIDGPAPLIDRPAPLVDGPAPLQEAPAPTPRQERRSAGWGLLVGLVIAILCVAVVIVFLVASRQNSTASGGSGASATTDPGSTTTVTSAPTTEPSTDPTSTTVPSAPSTSLDPSTAAAVDLSQRWASALADHDWSTARTLQPATADRTDDQMAHDYGGLHDAQIIYVSGDAGLLHVASVAHESVASGPQTSVWCFTIQPEAGLGSLTVPEGHRAAGTPVPSWVDASTLSSAIAECG